MLLNNKDLVGLNKEEILSLVRDGKLATTNQFTIALSSMKVKGPNLDSLRPTTIRLGDVFRVVSLGNHPAIVVSIKKSIYYCLLLTTERSCPANVEEIDSRFISGYITLSLTIATQEQILSNYMGTFNNNKQLASCKKFLKLIINKL